MSKPFYTSLKNRGLIHIEGEDRIQFLQGLVSNDVTKLEKEKILYACLMTPQGKFLHDFFMIHGDGFIMLDCEGGARADDLYERLNKHRLRSDVFLSVEETSSVYAVYNSSDDGLPDPRHFKMGNRSFDRPDGIEQNFEEWDKERIALCIPDGSRDLEIERSTLLECGLDKLNAIDWDKGCYMGQELTARMHYRGLGKKSLVTLKFDDTPLPEPFSNLEINGKSIGNMRSSCDNIGLAIIRNDAIETLKSGTKNNVQSEETNYSIRLLGL